MSITVRGTGNHLGLSNGLGRLPVVLVLALSGSTFAWAADDEVATTLLNELQTVTTQLRELEAQGQRFKETRASSRREMDRMDSRESALTSERAGIDSRVADYTSQSREFNSQCTGATVSQAASRNCDAQQRQLANLAASIDRDAERLASKVDDYNEEVDEYNVDDDELASQEEAIFAQTEALVSRIEGIKSRFEAFAVSTGDNDFVTDTRQCNALPGFEDTHFCLTNVWQIVSF